jgi:hypothetical protein
MSFRQCPAPSANRVSPQVDEPRLTELDCRLREQPAQLLDRRWCCLMNVQILLHQLLKRHLPART